MSKAHLDDLDADLNYGPGLFLVLKSLQGGFAGQSGTAFTALSPSSIECGLRKGRIIWELVRNIEPQISSEKHGLRIYILINTLGDSYAHSTLRYTSLDHWLNSQFFYT